MNDRQREIFMATDPSVRWTGDDDVVVEVGDVQNYIASLEAYKDDVQNAVDSAMDEACGTEKHCTCVPLLRHQIATLSAERDALARRVAGLEGVVAKLPKCWRLDEHGTLVQDAPVTPGMLIYSPHHNHPHYKEPAIAGLKSSGDCPIAAYGWGMNVAGHEVANSLEAAAALAAKEVGDGK